MIRGLLPLRHLFESIPSRERLEVTAANMKGAHDGSDFRPQGTDVLVENSCLTMNQMGRELKSCPINKDWQVT